MITLSIGCLHVEWIDFDHNLTDSIVFEIILVFDFQVKLMDSFIGR